MLIDCPERYTYPDWAASRHIFLSHTVVHNYLLADIIASQLQFRIENEILQDPLGFDKGIVITSYSIHYTKLYDADCFLPQPACFRYECVYTHSILQ